MKERKLIAEAQERICIWIIHATIVKGLNYTIKFNFSSGNYVKQRYRHHSVLAENRCECVQKKRGKGEINYFQRKIKIYAVIYHIQSHSSNSFYKIIDVTRTLMWFGQPCIILIASYSIWLKRYKVVVRSDIYWLGHENTILYFIRTKQCCYSLAGKDFHWYLCWIYCYFNVNINTFSFLASREGTWFNWQCTHTLQTTNNLSEVTDGVHTPWLPTVNMSQVHRDPTYIRQPA